MLQRDPDGEQDAVPEYQEGSRNRCAAPIQEDESNGNRSHRGPQDQQIPEPENRPGTP